MKLALLLGALAAAGAPAALLVTQPSAPTPIEKLTLVDESSDDTGRAAMVPYHPYHPYRPFQPYRPSRPFLPFHPYHPHVPDIAVGVSPAPVVSLGRDPS